MNNGSICFQAAPSAQAVNYQTLSTPHPGGMVTLLGDGSGFWGLAGFAAAFDSIGFASVVMFVLPFVSSGRVGDAVRCQD